MAQLRPGKRQLTLKAAFCGYNTVEMTSGLTKREALSKFQVLKRTKANIILEIRKKLFC